MKNNTMIPYNPKKDLETNYYNKTEVELLVAGGSGGSIDLSNYYKKLETYSKAQVDALVAGGGADLSDYYTKAEVESLISAIPATDLTNYYNKTEVESLIVSAGAGLSSEDRIKLDGIAVEATKNKTDNFLLDRSNHTGKQGIDTITDLDSIIVTLNNKINAVSSPFKGIYANLTNFKIENNKYPVGEEPADGNVTNSLPNDNFYNLETGSLYYFTTDKIWIDGNNKLQIKFDEVNSTITTINNNLETVNEVMANGKYMGAYDNLIDIPKSIPVLDEEDNPVIDVDSSLPVTQDVLVNSYAVV